MKLEKWDLVIGKEYVLKYDEQKPKIVKLLAVDNWGDCKLQYKNNHVDVYNYCYLEKIA